MMHGQKNIKLSHDLNLPSHNIATALISLRKSWRANVAQTDKTCWNCTPSVQLNRPWILHN